MAAPAAWPTVPPLQIVPLPLQLPLLGVAAPAPAALWERRHVVTDGGPVVVVRIARTPDGAAWRVSFGLAHLDDNGTIEHPEGAALDVDTFGAARAAADFGWLLVAGAAAAFVRHVSGAAAAAAVVVPDRLDDVEPVEPGGPRVLQFRTRDELAPTG